MLQKLRNHLKSDRAASGIVSVLAFTLLMVGLAISLIDYTMYSNARDMVTTAASQGSRDVAIFGGAGTADKATVIEKKYGATRAEACSMGRFDGGKANMFGKLVKSDSNAVECNVIYALSTTSLGAINFDGQGDGVKCTPVIAGKVGQNVSCSIQYTYSGVPGSVLGFIQGGEKNGLAMTVQVTSTSSAETGLTAADLVNR